MLAKPNICERLRQVKTNTIIIFLLVTELVKQIHTCRRGVRVFSRQGDRFDLSKMKLLTSRKKQFRQ